MGQPRNPADLKGKGKGDKDKGHKGKASVQATAYAGTFAMQRRPPLNNLPPLADLPDPAVPAHFIATLRVNVSYSCQRRGAGRRGGS